MSERARASAKAEPVLNGALEREDAEPNLARRKRKRARTSRDEERRDDRARTAPSAARTAPPRRQPVEVPVYVSSPGDRFEQEADRAAADALGPGPLAAPLTRIPGGAVQRAASPGTQGDAQAITRSRAFNQRLDALRGGGERLPPAVLRYFQDRFRFDFSGVRLHTGRDAIEAARLAGARAFTSRRDVVFGASEYSPYTREGQRLLGHELAHVMQQRGIGDRDVSPVLRQAVPGQPDLISQGAVATLPPPVNDDLASASDPALNVPEPKKPDEKPEKDVAAAADDRRAAEEEKKRLPATAGGKPKPSEKADRSKKATADEDAKKKAGAGKKPDEKTDEKAEGAKKEEGAKPETLEDLSSGDLALIDEELAEHERWAGAAAMVGTAGSEDRARFVIASALGGEVGGFGSGVVGGLKMGAGIRAAEFGAGKAAATLAAKYGAKFGVAAAKFTPLPAVGAIIGGAFAAVDLIGRDWEKTGETIGRFGQGADTYEQLANSIAAVSEILDVATQVMNVIAGVIGVIAVASWAIAIVTLGVASPLAATLTAIASGIGIAAMIIDAINALVLKQLIVVFRALHTYVSDADPRDIVAQGEKIGQSAEAASGFLGGLVGGKAAAHAGAKPKVPVAEQPTPHPDHPNPPTASGEGPRAKGEPPVEAKGAAPETKAAAPETKATEPETKAAPPETAPPPPAPGGERTVKAETGATPPAPAEAATKPAVARPEAKPPAVPQEAATAKPATLDELRKQQDIEEQSFESLRDSVVKEMNEGSFGDKLEAEAKKADVPPPTAPPGSKWVYSSLKRLLQKEAPRPEGTQAQHWTKWLASVRDIKNPLQRLAQDFINRNRSWLQSRKKGRATLLLQDPRAKKGREYRGTQYVVGEHAYGSTRGSQQLALPGFELPPPERRYSTEHKFADAYMIEQAKKSILASRDEAAKKAGTTAPPLDPNLLNLWGGAEARWRMEGIPGQGEWGWQPQATAGAKGQASLPGIAPPAPKTPIPVDPRQTSFDFSRRAPTSESPQLDLFAPKPAAEPIRPGAGTETGAPVVEKAAGPVGGSEVVPATIPEAPPPVATAAVEAKSRGAETEAFTGMARLAIADVTGRAGEREETEKQERPGFWSNLGAFKRDVSRAPVPYALAGAVGGPVASYAAWAGMKAGEGFAKARREPVVERVNPQYPEPPGTLQDHVNAKNRLLDILAARAQAEAARKTMAHEEAKHKANEEPIKKTQDATKKAISATEAHKQVIARRSEANKKSADNEQGVGQKIDEYGKQSAKLVVITGPLKAFERFTYLANYLPNWPRVLKRVKKSILKVHSDAEKFLQALDNTDRSMKSQSAEQPKRKDQIAADAGTIGSTDEKAAKSAQQLDDTQKGAQAVGDDNKANLELAQKTKHQAAGDIRSLDGQAKQQQAQIESIGAAWQSWADRHRQARADALQQTRKRMEQLGYQNIETMER